jgi:hypothetical protein
MLTAKEQGRLEGESFAPQLAHGCFHVGPDRSAVSVTTPRDRGPLLRARPATYQPYVRMYCRTAANRGF